jgi:hypothetical protein
VTKIETVKMASDAREPRAKKVFVRTSPNPARKSREKATTQVTKQSTRNTLYIALKRLVAAKTDLGKRTVASSGPKAIASPGRSALTVTFPSNNHADHNTCTLSYDY